MCPTLSHTCSKDTHKCDDADFTINQVKSFGSQKKHICLKFYQWQCDIKAKAPVHERRTRRKGIQKQKGISRTRERQKQKEMKNKQNAQTIHINRDARRQTCPGWKLFSCQTKHLKVFHGPKKTRTQACTHLLWLT